MVTYVMENWAVVSTLFIGVGVARYAQLSFAGRDPFKDETE